MSGLRDVAEVRLPQRCLNEAMTHLRRVGRRGEEGIALFAGRRHGDAIDVVHTLVPKQIAIRSKRGVCVIVEPAELHRVNVWLYQNDRVLVGQIHSHPAEAYHSSTDEEFPIATTVGSLSLVVPDFAAAPFSLRTTAVYRLSADAQWQELNAAEAASLLHITDS